MHARDLPTTLFVPLASGGVSDGNNPSGSTSTPDSGEQLQSVLANTTSFAPFC